MSGIARVGDQCGGTIITGASSVMINGTPCARIGSIISPHPDKHNAQVIITGSSSILVEGIPAATMNSLGSCGHSVSTGSGNVMGG